MTTAAVSGDFTVAAPERGPRPATVTIAAAFQATAVLMLLAAVAFAWLARAQYDGFADRAAELVRVSPGELDSEHTANLVMAIVFTVLAGAGAIWFGVTLRPLLRGSNVARIVAAIGAFGVPGVGLVLTIGSCVSGLFFAMLFAAAPFEEDPYGGSYDDGSIEDFPGDSPFQNKLYELQDSAPFTWSTLLPIVGMLAMCALAVVAVLLVIPPTNRWFNPGRALAKAGHPYPVYYPVYYPYPVAQPQPPATPEE